MMGLYWWVGKRTKAGWHGITTDGFPFITHQDMT